MVGTTIPYEVREEYCAARVMLKPASKGTGVIAGGAVRAVVEAAGVRDILAKVHGSTNPVNVTRATLNALKSLRSVEDHERMRGVKLRLVVPGQAAAAVRREAADAR
jgi:small subunit ribosomal protein S5